MNKGPIYLSGPMEFCDDEQCYGWRKRISNLIGSKYVIIPTALKCISKPSEIDRIKLVEQDLNDIRNSVGILCNFWKIGVGTSMELVYASQWGKPVVTVVPQQAFVSPWLSYHSTLIVEGQIEDGLKELKRILRWEE